MKKKMPAPIKDGLVGLAIGTAVIVPGISAGTIALVLGSFKKITSAASKLFTKDFWKNGRSAVEYIVEELSDYADYIYDAECLRTLAGKKYHKKKNNVNAFARGYEIKVGDKLG